MKRFYLCLICLFMGALPVFSQPGTVINQFPSPVSNPADLAWDGQYLYLLGLTDHKIYQIDPTNGQVLSSISTGITGALGLTYFDGHFWISRISDNTLNKLDTNGNIIKTVSIPTGQCIGIEWDGTAFWVADSDPPSEKIVQVDSTGTLLHSFLFPGDSPFGLTWDGQTIWCADNHMSATAIIYQFDPITGTIITSFPCPYGGGAANGLAWDGQYLWIADNSNDKIYQVEGNPLPQFGAIAGRVIDDSTGWGIGYIPVLNTYTDTSGYFLADSLAPGYYNLTFQAPGFYPGEIDSVQVTPGDTAHVFALLQPIGRPFVIQLREADSDEWSLRVYRDSLWRYYEMPLGLFRGSGSTFLNTPVTYFVLQPVDGGWNGSTFIEVADWIDAILLGDTLIDDFDDGDIYDWDILLAYNGSELTCEPDTLTPDGSPYSLKMKHTNLLMQPFVGWMEKHYSGLNINPTDTLRFYLRGTSYPISGLEQTTRPIAGSPRLEANFPNPFNPSTTIRFLLGRRERAVLEIYSVTGEKVRTLVNGVLNPGWQEVSWNGRNDAGKKVSSGVYIYRLRTGHFSQSRKMLLVR